MPLHVALGGLDAYKQLVSSMVAHSVARAASCMPGSPALLLATSPHVSVWDGSLAAEYEEVRRGEGGKAACHLLAKCRAKNVQMPVLPLRGAPLPGFLPLSAASEQASKRTLPKLCRRRRRNDADASQVLHSLEEEAHSEEQQRQEARRQAQQQQQQQGADGGGGVRGGSSHASPGKGFGDMGSLPPPRRSTECAVAEAALSSSLYGAAVAGTLHGGSGEGGAVAGVEQGLGHTLRDTAKRPYCCVPRGRVTAGAGRDDPRRAARASRSPSPPHSPTVLLASTGAAHRAASPPPHPLPPLPPGRPPLSPQPLSAHPSSGIATAPTALTASSAFYSSAGNHSIPSLPPTAAAATTTSARSSISGLPAAPSTASSAADGRPLSMQRSQTFADRPSRGSAASSALPPIPDSGAAAADDDRATGASGRSLRPMLSGPLNFGTPGDLSDLNHQGHDDMGGLSASAIAALAVASGRGFTPGYSSLTQPLTGLSSLVAAARAAAPDPPEPPEPPAAGGGGEAAAPPVVGLGQEMPSAGPYTDPLRASLDAPSTPSGAGTPARAASSAAGAIPEPLPTAAAQAQQQEGQAWPLEGVASLAHGMVGGVRQGAAAGGDGEGGEAEEEAQALHEDPERSAVARFKAAHGWKVWRAVCCGTSICLDAAADIRLLRRSRSYHESFSIPSPMSFSIPSLAVCFPDTCALARSRSS